MRVTVAGWTGSRNLGDELVASALVRMLGELGAEVSVISVDPPATARTHGVDSVGAGPVAQWRQTARTDLGVLGGGGLLQDESSVLNLPYHLARPALWRARGVPWVGIGLGAGLLSHAASRQLVRAVLASARAVTVRDDASARLLRPLLEVPAVVGADLAFTLPAPRVATEDVTVVALRGWTGRRLVPAGAARQRASRSGFVPAMATALDRLATATGRATRFVAFDGANDDAVHAEVAAAMTTPTQRRVPGVADVLDEVARGEVVVAMRYHALVAAALGARPAVALPYSPKVASLAAELGPACAPLGVAPRHLAGLAEAALEVAGTGEAAAAARERLRARADVHRQVLAAHLDPPAGR